MVQGVVVTRSLCLPGTYNWAASSTACSAAPRWRRWIWCRQLVPSATTMASGAERTAGRLSLGHLHGHGMVLRLVTEAAGHAAAAGFDQLRLHAGNQPSSTGDTAPKAFWWQWP